MPLSSSFLVCTYFDGAYPALCPEGHFLQLICLNVSLFCLHTWLMILLSLKLLVYFSQRTYLPPFVGVKEDLSLSCQSRSADLPTLRLICTFQPMSSVSPLYLTLPSWFSVLLTAWVCLTFCETDGLAFPWPLPWQTLRLWLAQCQFFLVLLPPGNLRHFLPTCCLLFSP